MVAGEELSPHGNAPVLELRNLSVSYSGRLAVENISMAFSDAGITAIIGPSGCGKSTILKTMNRMLERDLVPAASVEGQVLYRNQDIYDANIDPVVIRKHIGMVFQKPNVFPKSIYSNVEFGAKYAVIDRPPKKDLPVIVESALRRAALLDEVADRLGSSALTLSGGQQQRLCIARALAVAPEVLLMDEPCSALDPIATFEIETLMRNLANEGLSIVIVTHNIQQAGRIADKIAFVSMDIGQDSDRVGRLVEFGDTDTMINRPKNELTERFVTGRFG